MPTVYQFNIFVLGIPKKVHIIYSYIAFQPLVYENRSQILQFQDCLSIAEMAFHFNICVQIGSHKYFRFVTDAYSNAFH